MRPLVTVLGFAVVTAAATLVVGWSGETYADPPETFLGSGDVDDVSFNGELVRDATFKTGWAIKVTFQNRGDDDETCTLDTELTRSEVNPGSRASPPGVAVWHHKDRVTVAAHEEVARSYDVPQWMAAQLTSNDKAMSIREKVVEKENQKPAPNFALQMRPYTMYGVAFQKVDG
jgi:hypothetical protein